MSDVVATYGLDYGDYRKGLAALEKTTARHFAKQTAQSNAAARAVGTAAKAFIGGNVIQTSIRLATAAIGEFAERSPEAARSLESISKAGKSAAASLGQDLYYALGLGEGKLEGFIKKADELRTTLVDKLAAPWREMFGDSTVEELNAARASELDSQQFSKFQKEDKVRGLETRAGIAEAGGNGDEAARLREQARNQRATMEIGAIAYAPERDARKKQEEELHAANMARIEREIKARGDAERQRAAADARRMEMEQTLFNLEAAALSIQGLRAQGRDEEADKAEVMLKYAQQEARIRGDAALNDRDVAHRVSVNNARRDQELENLSIARAREVAEEAARAAADATRQEIVDPGGGILGGVQGTASIESGLGGRSGLRAQVFGPGGAVDGDGMTREQKRSNALLERIERNTARQGAAVFA